MRHRKGKLKYPAMATAVLCICMLPMAVHAGSDYWVGGNGDWDVSSNWSTTSGGTGGAGQPVGGDDISSYPILWYQHDRYLCE